MPKTSFYVDGTEYTALASADTVLADMNAIEAQAAADAAAAAASAAAAALAVTGYAPLASPAFTGTPTAPTAAVNTNTTQIASTAFVLAQAATALPLIDGAVAVGTATKFAREDHVHPTDTTRAPLASPTFTGTPAAPTPTVGDNTTKLATTAFVQSAVSAGGAGKPFVILTAGQSNFVLKPSLAWTPEANAKIWNNTVGVVGTGTAFAALDATTVSLPAKLASEIARAAPGRTVYLINSSFSGMAISHWLTGTGAPDGYADGKANIQAALAAIGATKIDMFAWWQGEADTGPLNTSYVANHATMMARYFAETWFPRETPILICSIADSATSTNADGDHMNDVLLAVVNADPDKRRYVYTASLSGATYWDGSNLGHMTAAGYYAAGAMAANVFLNGTGRNSLKNVVVDPSTGTVAIGASVVSGSAPLTVSQNTAYVMSPVVAPVINYMVGADGASVWPLIDSFGNFSNFIGRRANGTYAAKTALATDDIITGIGAQGYDSSAAYSSGNVSAFLMFAGANWTSSNHGTYASIFNTPNGSVTGAENARFTNGKMQIFGTTSGSIAFAVPAVSGSNTITWPAGTTDFSATGGTSKVVKQTSAGGALTVAQVDVSDLTDGAWTAYTPTVTASTGTFTTVSATGRYKRLGAAGKTIFLQADVTITTAGTAAFNLLISLPFTGAAFSYVGTAREHALTGKSGAAIIPPSGTTAVCTDATGTTLIASGNVVAIGITYEIP